MMAMPRLNTLSFSVTTLDTRTVKPPPKQVDPHYLSPAPPGMASGRL